MLREIIWKSGNSLSIEWNPCRKVCELNTPSLHHRHLRVCQGSDMHRVVKINIYSKLVDKFYHVTLKKICDCTHNHVY